MPPPLQYCVNHPRRETRVSCGACGKPICTDCMRETPVGMKCPACARLPLHARGYGRPEHYVRATGLGLAAATVLGVLITLVSFGLFGIILPIAVGVVVGLAVSRGASGVRHSSIAAIAAACTVLGLVAGGIIAGSSLRGVLGGGQLFGLVIAAMAAAFVANR